MTEKEPGGTKCRRDTHISTWERAPLPCLPASHTHSLPPFPPYPLPLSSSLPVVLQLESKASCILCTNSTKDLIPTFSQFSWRQDLTKVPRFALNLTCCLGDCLNLQTYCPASQRAGMTGLSHHSQLQREGGGQAGGPTEGKTEWDAEETHPPETALIEPGLQKCPPPDQR